MTAKAYQFLIEPEERTWVLPVFAAGLYGIFLAGYYLYFDVSFFLGVETPMAGDGFWQFLPYSVLKERPLESLLYLHSRPPLGNLLLALGFALGIGARIFAFWNHLVGGLIFFYASRFIFHFSGRRRFAFFLILAFVYGISLNFLAFLNDMIYTLSAASLMTAFAWHGFALLRGGRRADLILAICFGGLLSLQRATYGMPVFALFAGLLFLRRGLPTAGGFFAGAAAPALLWSFKNWLVFGIFGMSTLFGMTLYFNAGQNFFLTERRTSPEWIAVKERVETEHPELAPLLAGSMLKVSRYEKEGFQIERNETYEGIPALQRHEKDSWWGLSNKNTYEYIQISRGFRKLSFALIRIYPENYLLNCWYAAYQFFKPAWMYRQTVNPVWNTHPHLFKVFRLSHLDFDVALKMRLSVSHGWDMFVYAYFAAVLGLFAGWLAGGWRAAGLPYLYLLLLLGVGTAGGILFTHAENMRYKFEIEPLVRALFLGGIGLGLDRLIRKKWKPGRPAGHARLI